VFIVSVRGHTIITSNLRSRGEVMPGVTLCDGERRGVVSSVTSSMAYKNSYTNFR